MENYITISKPELNPTQRKIGRFELNNLFDCVYSTYLRKLRQLVLVEEEVSLDDHLVNFCTRYYEVFKEEYEYLDKDDLLYLIIFAIDVGRYKHRFSPEEQAKLGYIGFIWKMDQEGCPLPSCLSHLLDEYKEEVGTLE